ncbi:MAG TPA: efflux RND transporter permease subunit, partial [Vicinamibacterales bacterium]|nr:efflux RND transporter permease subunit [Vicinamibacterales bacterium]
TSSEGSSRVNITFNLAKDPDVAAQEVRAKVDPLIRNLPETADPPVVQKQDPDSTPIMLFSVAAPLLAVELTTYIEQNIQKRLESVNGVGEVILYGARRRELQVKVDPDRLNAYGLSTGDVASALRAQNLELPGGRLEQGLRDLSVRTVGRLSRPEEFLDLVITRRGSIPIRIRDVGIVEDTGATPTSVTTLNGRSAVSIAIRKQSGENTVALADAIRARMAEVEKTLPPNFDIRLIRDDSEFIRASMRAIEEHLILGGILAALVVLLFLRNLRSTLITAIAIPTSIIGAFSLMAALDFTLNQMTMLALTLMVGIVIDDAIVVLENIYRFVEEKGLSPFQAAIEGTREIGLAVMATTLALLAVFVPVGFLGGIVGRFMSSFGLTSAAAIAISLLVSFTLTPMLAARWIKPRRADDRAAEAGGEASRRGFYRHIDRAYTGMLRWSMAHRIAIVAICALVMGSLVPLFRVSGVNFTPDEDESRFQITARLPPDASLAATQTLLDQIARDAREKLPGVTDTLCITGFGGGGGLPNAGIVFVRLAPIEQREHSQQELVIQARQLVQPYRKAAVISIQGSGGLTAISGRGASIQYALVGPDLDKLDVYTTQAVKALQSSTQVVDADRGYLPGKPELRISVDRNRAADLGVQIETISQTVNALLAGQEVTTFNAASDQYDVVLKAADAFRRTPDSVADATVRTAGGQLVPLRTLVTFTEGQGPGSIDRLNRQRQITISANPAPGFSQAEGQQAVQAAFEALDTEPGYSLVASGSSRELGRAAYYFAIAFALSFVFMYMVLAAQFESFIHPVTILLTLPIAVPCGLLASLLFGQQLNIYSALGVLLLFGIVKKNAILQIDHTIGLRAKGYERDVAIIQANRDRLRPILMTTLSLIAGMLPLCLGSGPGAETNRSIGLLVVGGQALCLVLTLLAVPVFYSLFDDAAASPAWARYADRFRRASGPVTRTLRRLTGRVPEPAKQGVDR